MNPLSVDERLQMLAHACRSIENAIDLLDTAEAPGHIAANLDLALNQLEGALKELGRSHARRFDARGEDCGTEPVA